MLGVRKSDSGVLMNPREAFGYGEWVDTGCVVSDACLRCPLPICKHDDKEWFNKYVKLSKHRHAIMELKDGLNNGNMTQFMHDLSEKYKATTRTMWRLKRRIEDEDLDFEMIELFYRRIHKRVYGR